MPVKFKPKPLTAKPPKVKSPVVRPPGSVTSMLPMAGVALASGLPAIANIFAARSAADVVSNITENPVALGAVVLVALAVLLR